MEEKTVHKLNRLGAFDLIKGLAMPLVVLSHSIGAFSAYSSGKAGIFLLIIMAFSTPAISSFLIVSGYGFRKVPFLKCLKQQVKIYLKPFLAVSAVTVLFSFIFNGVFFYRGAFLTLVKDTCRLLGAFAFGLPRSGVFLGHRFFDCLPFWFFFVLWIGWILLDGVLNLIPEKWEPLGVIAFSCLGVLVGHYFLLPYCISQAMVLTLYLYLGFLAKKKKWLMDPSLRKKSLIMMVLSAACIIAFALLRGRTDDVTETYWNFGPLGVWVDAVFAFSLVGVYISMNFPENRLTAFLEFMGRRSLVIYCLHCVELLAFPWYRLMPKFENAVFLGVVCFFLVHCCLIAIFFFALQGVERLKKHFKKHMEGRKI